MSHCQNSKRAREIRKITDFLGLPCYFSHPSHISGRRNTSNKYRDKFVGLSENKIYFGCESCGKFWGVEFKCCRVFLGKLEKIKICNGKIEIIDK